MSTRGGTLAHGALSAARSRSGHQQTPDEPLPAQATHSVLRASEALARAQESPSGAARDSFVGRVADWIERNIGGDLRTRAEGYRLLVQAWRNPDRANRATRLRRAAAGVLMLWVPGLDGIERDTLAGPLAQLFRSNRETLARLNAGIGPEERQARIIRNATGLLAIMSGVGIAQALLPSQFLTPGSGVSAPVRDWASGVLRMAGTLSQAVLTHANTQRVRVARSVDQSQALRATRTAAVLLKVQAQLARARQALAEAEHGHDAEQMAQQVARLEARERRLLDKG